MLCANINIYACLSCDIKDLCRQAFLEGKDISFLDNLTMGTFVSLVHSDHQAMSHVIWTLY